VDSWAADFDTITGKLTGRKPMDEMPTEFWQGVEQFNQRRFYECHDTLEAIWMEAPPADKKFYQGILQIAVALYHLGNENWRGTVILMGEGISRLGEYLPSYGGMDVEGFLRQTIELHQELQKLGPEKVAIAMQELGYQRHNEELQENDLEPSGRLKLQFPSLQIAEPL
jgi:predicted metal-dependent hydrolase